MMFEDLRMTTTHPELHTSRRFQGLILPAHPTSGTEDDDDDRDDEHAGENEAPVRAVDEDTETPRGVRGQTIRISWVIRCGSFDEYGRLSSIADNVDPRVIFKRLSW
jgi:hypothetical protein